MLDTGQADRIRAAGVPVVETAGWQTRGSSAFFTKGGVNHHTGGSRFGTVPSLMGVIHGFPGSAPGPLANVLQSREPGEGNDKAYIVAAGRANHAGRGGWRGLVGNSTVYGLEIEHTGIEPLPMHRQVTAAKIHAALAGGKFRADMVCQHREWAPLRKIDAATQVDPQHFRAMVATAMHLPPKPVPSGAAAMKIVKHPKVKGYYIASADGGVFAFGEDVPFFGSMGGKPLNAPMVGMAVRPQGDGYILAGADGGVFNFGGSQFYGSMGGKPMNSLIVDVEYDPEGDGYWLLGEDGGVFTFGAADFYGSAAEYL